MARERIDDIVSQSAIEQLVALGQQLQAVKEQMNDLIVDVAKFSAELNNVGSVRDMGQAVNNLNAATEKLSQTNRTRLDLEREIKRDGEAMAKQVQEETNHFEQLGKVMEQYVKTQGQTANAIIALEDSLKRNKTALKNVSKAYEEGEISAEEYRRTKVELMNEGEKLSKQLKEERKSYKSINTDLNTAEGSYEQLSTRLTQLRNIWKGLSEEERESADVGGVLKTEINNLDEALKGMDTSIGNNQRNVGNYAQAISNLRNPMVLLQGGLKGIGVQLKALLANPIVLIIGAVVAILKKLWDEFKKNDDSMTALKASFEAFRPILKAVSDVFQFLVGAIAKGVTAVTNLAMNIAGKLNPALKEQMENTRTLVLLQDKLEENERRQVVNSAVRQKKIAELMNKSRERSKYSLQERIAFLEEAQDLEEKDIAERKKNAAIAWKLAKDTAKNDNDTSDETKDNIASLLAAYINLDKELQDHSRRRISALESLKKEELDLAKQQQKASAELKKQMEADLRAQQQRNKSLSMSIEDLTTKLIVDAKEQEKALHQINMTRIEEEEELQKKEAKNEEERVLIEKLTDLKIEDEIKRHNDKIKEIEDKASAEAKDKALKEYQERLKNIDKDYDIEYYRLQNGESTYKSLLDLQRSYNETARQLNEQAYEQGLVDYKDYILNKERLTAEEKELDKSVATTKMQASQSVIGSITDVMMAGAEQIEDEKRRVKVQQAITMAKVLLTESLAIAEAVLNQTSGDPYSYIPRVIASVATITATFATAIATISKAQNAYAEGTDYHRGGSAIVGEGMKNGQWQSEVVETPDGRRFIVDRPTYFQSMPVGTKVTPMEHYNGGVDMTTTNSILEKIANKGQVVVNVDDKITNYILTKNSRIRVLNNKFKY